MPRFRCCLNNAIRYLKTSPKIVSIVSKTSVLFLLIAWSLSPLTTYASWYVGGSILLHPLPYRPFQTNYIKLGTSRVSLLANGISLNTGYKFCLRRLILATEFDIGSFSDADGELIYQNLEHYVSATYYFALKQKFGYPIRFNFMGYGLLGLSQNSIGDRIYFFGKYYNKKQVSYLYGAGLEYYTLRDCRIALFVEGFYFAPTRWTSYSGGARPPSTYSLSTRGVVLQFGMRYYFD